MRVEKLGSGPRVVFVHGSVANGAVTWAKQRALANRFTILIVNRPGYPPDPPLARIDFEEQAAELASLLKQGDHLVGHSYGGVISLLAAEFASLGSLTVMEPPAFGLARGHPAVEDFLHRFPAEVRDPRAYLERFLPLIGSKMKLPDPLPPQLEAGARALMVERSPHEADIPLDALAEADFPKLVVSAAHNAGLDAVCDVLEKGLGAERVVTPGAGHSIPRAPGFNDVLIKFLGRATR